MRPIARHSGGQSAVEYLVVLAALAIAFGLAGRGQIDRLVDAVADRYARFTWAISLP